MIMKHVYSLSTHCSHMAGAVTKNSTYFRIFLVANIGQCHQKGLQLWQSWWKNPEVKLCLLLVWYFLRERYLPLSDLGSDMHSCPPVAPSPASLLQTCSLSACITVLTFSHGTNEYESERVRDTEYMAGIKYRPLIILSSPYLQVMM